MHKIKYTFKGLNELRKIDYVIRLPFFLFKKPRSCIILKKMNKTKQKALRKVSNLDFIDFFFKSKTR